MPETIGTAYVQIEPSTRGIEGKLDSALGTEAEKAGKSAGNKLGSAMGSALKVGSVAIAGATAAIGGFATASVNAGKEFDSAMSQVAATMGFSTAELNDSTSEASQQFQQLRDFAQEMGSTTAFSASESAEALNYMALAGYDAETSMKMLPTVLSLAAAGGIDLASASDMVTDAQSALGLTLEETSTMVDQMAKASSKSNTSVAQLGEAFLTIGANAKSLSGGTTELSTALGLLANNGIKGAEGGTHLRNIMLALNPTTDKAVKAWEQLGVSAYDADGNLRPLEDTFGDLNNAMESMTDQEKSNILTEMFNKTDLAAVNALLDTSANKWDELGSAIESASGLGSLSTEKLQGIAYDLQYNFEEMGGDMSAFTSEMMDYLTSEYDMSESIAKQAIDMFSESIKDGNVNVDELVKSYQELGGAAQDMANTQLDNLAGDVTLFQSALEGAKIAVSDQLTPTLREFVQFGSEGLSQLTAAFQDGGLDGAMDALGDLLSQLVVKIVDMLPEITSAGASLLSAFGEGILSALPTILPMLVQLTTEAFSMLVQLLPEALSILIESLPMIIDMVCMALIDCLPQLIDGAVQLVVLLAEHLPEIITSLINAIPQIIITIVKTIIAEAPKLLEAGVKLILALGDGIKSMQAKINDIGTDLILKVVAKIKEKFTEFKEVGKNLIEGLWNGIQDAKAWLIDKIKGFCDSALGAIKDFFGIHSPSRVLADEVGKFLPEGLAVGIEANADSALSAMDELGSGMNATLTNDLMGMGTDYTGTTYATQQSADNGLYELLSTYLPMIANGQNIKLEGDAGQLFKMVRSQNDIYKNAHNRSAFA